MKFLCPSCKAKYQIADEKVIGRSVKMKCRQCGHIIEIQESVLGASATVSQPPIALTSIPAPSSPPKPPAEKMVERPQSSLGSNLSAKAPTKPSRTLGTAEAVGARAIGVAAPTRNLRPPGASGGRLEAPARGGIVPRSHTPTPGPSYSPPRVSSGGGAGPASERSVPRPTLARTPQVAGPAVPVVRAPASRNLGISRPAQATEEPHREARPSPAARTTPAAIESVRSAVTARTGRIAPVVAAPRGTGEALAEAFTSAVGVASSLSN